MAVLDSLTGMMPVLGKTIFMGLVTLIFCSIIILIAWLIMRAKRYKHYKCLIFKRKKDKEKKEQLVFVGIDKAGIIYDKKTKKRLFHLKAHNIRLGEEESIAFDENRNLDIPSIPSETGGEIVFLEKLGPRKFAFGMPYVFEGQAKIIVTEADCAEAIRSYDINAKYYGGAEWQKWVGPIAFAVFAVLTIVLIYTVMQKFDVLSTVSERLVETARILQSGKTSAVASSVP